MIFYYFWRDRIIARADREKLLFFFGLTPNPLYLSRRWPLFTSINWLKAFFSPRYARAISGWMRYRVELYDGLQG